MFKNTLNKAIVHGYTPDIDRNYHAGAVNGLLEGPGGLPLVAQFGLNSNKAVNFSGLTVDTSGNMTAPGNLISSGLSIENHVPVAVNATATLTSAQVATGYITSTSAAAVTMTLPTGTLLGGVLAAVQGTTLDLYIDNTAGANTVTMAVATNGIKSDAAATTAASFGQLTVASGVTGIGRFTIMFSSATAYVFTRTA